MTLRPEVVASHRPSGLQAANSIGFSNESAMGADRTYLVTEIPPEGDAPTTGIFQNGTDVLSVTPVLFTAPGQIATAVDIGNLVVVNLDMGPDLTVNEGQEVPRLQQLR